MNPSDPRFFICKECGNLVQMLHDGGIPLVCDGKEMSELAPNTSEGAGEKHMPVVSRSGDIIKVEVGSVYHPMSEEHSIQWIYLQTAHGGQFYRLSPDEEPKAEFCLHGEKSVAAYAYCNLHGLWKTEIKE